MSYLECREVSEWLIEVLQAGDGSTASLQQIMEVAVSEMDIKITDSTGEVHGLGDWLFELAHIIVLDHHWKQGNLEIHPRDERQAEVWRLWQADELLKPEYQRDEVREIAFYKELFAIPMRLSRDGRRRYYKETIVHVGSIEM